MNLKIVGAKEITWQQLKALRLEAVQTNPLSFAGSYEEDLAHYDTYWQNLLVSEDMKHLLALVDGKLVGSVSYYHHKLAKIRHLYHLCAMYVQPDHQRQGVGKKLVLAVINSIKQDPVAHKVTLAAGLDNPSALALYTSCGFKKVGIQKDELLVDGKYYDEVAMELILN